MSNLYIMHYGVGHDKGGHSGRYPWGSGENPFGATHGKGQVSRKVEKQMEKDWRNNEYGQNSSYGDLEFLEDYGWGANELGSVIDNALEKTGLKIKNYKDGMEDALFESYDNLFFDKKNSSVLMQEIKNNKKMYKDVTRVFNQDGEAVANTVNYFLDKYQDYDIDKWRNIRRGLIPAKILNASINEIKNSNPGSYEFKDGKCVYNLKQPTDEQVLNLIWDRFVEPGLP